MTQTETFHRKRGGFFEGAGDKRKGTVRLADIEKSRWMWIALAVLLLLAAAYVSAAKCLFYSESYVEGLFRSRMAEQGGLSREEIFPVSLKRSGNGVSVVYCGDAGLVTPERYPLYFENDPDRTFEGEIAAYGFAMGRFSLLPPFLADLHLNGPVISPEQMRAGGTVGDPHLFYSAAVTGEVLLNLSPGGGTEPGAEPPPLALAPGLKNAAIRIPYGSLYHGMETRAHSQWEEWFGSLGGMQVE